MLEVAELGLRRPSRGPFSTLAAQLLWHAGGLRAAARQRRPDVVHCCAFPPPRLDMPVIWTVHDDLVLGGHREVARRGAAVWAPLGRRALSYVDAVVTDTPAGARDLIAGGARADSVHVITPGVPQLPQPSGRPAATNARGESVPDGGFLLAVGTLEPRKRLDVVVGAAKRLNLPLVIAGHRAPGYALPEPFRREGVWITGPVTDSELAWLYHKALVLISASEYEGFNFPIAEAGRAGLPVAASDIPVHRDVCAEGTPLFEPGDPDDAARAIGIALDHPRNIRNDLPTWEEVASDYVNLYRRVAWSEH